MTILAAGVLLVWTTVVHGQPPAEPHWIWATDQDARPVVFPKSFHLGQQVDKAELFVAADFAQVVITLNDRPVASIDPYSDPVRVDVADRLNQGANTLAVRAAACAGPAAIAVRLDVRGRDGSTRRLVSDESWKVRREGAAEGAISQVADWGVVERYPWLLTPEAIAINPFDDYTQWMQAEGAPSTHAPATFQTLPGFEIEVLRAAQPDEGSWVSLAVDPRGRLVIGREDRGLLRLTLDRGGAGIERVETINDELQECRGLLFAHDALYVNANNSKGLYRLRDSDGDDQFDQVQLLYESAGGVGHGRNCLALGTDGLIYSIHGDSVELPTSFRDHTSPFREARRGGATHEGHVIRIDREGQTWELVTAGLRNPFGIDFNADGEMFTYDADAEFDMGAPWYRPTRVDHLVPGGDFGWRGVTGNWPPYFPDHPDNAPPTVDIGKGSPTAVKFGDRSDFPPRYQQALFILDWAYGRILAVHLTPRGASYFGRAETFLRGRPLNVTGLDFGLDGAMYFVTGGRKTQSSLYRVRYVGPSIAESPPTRQQTRRLAQAATARRLRRQLEALHRDIGLAAVDEAWPHLSSPDPSLRYAALVAMEHQPIATWKERALAEPEPLAVLTAILALARSGASDDASQIVRRLNEFPLGELSPTPQALALHGYELCLRGGATLDPALLEQAVRNLEPNYPLSATATNRILRELLVELGVAAIVPRMVAELQVTTDQADHLHGLFALRKARSGWTPALRRAYFVALRETDGYLAGQGMPGFLEKIREDATTGLSSAERAELGTLLLPATEESPRTESPPARPLVQAWTLADFDSLEAVGRERNHERGRRLYEAALCSRCHRLGPTGRPVGPDLTFVARRFHRRDLLEAILDPSKAIAENYRSHRIVTTDGKTYEGRVVSSGDYRDPTLKLATNPHAPAQLTVIPKAHIESHAESAVSFMPAGLLNTLNREEILDLLAFIEAAADEQAPPFRRTLPPAP